MLKVLSFTIYLILELQKSTCTFFIITLVDIKVHTMSTLQPVKTFKNINCHPKCQTLSVVRYKRESSATNGRRYRSPDTSGHTVKCHSQPV